MFKSKINTIPKISIVVLNYNGISYLKRVLPILNNLQYDNFEVVVVDNGSVDGSLDYITSQNISLINSPKIGEKNFACNYAVERVSGEFIFLMDNDVIIQDENILKKLVKRFNELSNVGQIGLCFLNEGESKIVSYGMYLSYFFSINLKPVNDLNFSPKQKISYADGKAFFMKRNIWKQVGGYDDHLHFGGDDNDLGIKLWIAGYKNYLYSDSVQLHIGMPERTNTIKYSNKFRKMVYGHFYTITKNYSFLNLVMCLPLYFVYSFFKAIKQSLKRVSYRPLIAWFFGSFDFVADIKYTLAQRKTIQKLRVSKDDIFLKIKRPRTNG